jgi:hypothetical protein
MLSRIFRNRPSRTAALTLFFGLVGAASMIYYQFGIFMPQVKTVLAAKRWPAHMLLEPTSTRSG